MAAMSSTTTPVDLSRLPAPQLVDPMSLDAIYAAMVTDLVAAGIPAPLDSDPSAKVLKVAAYRELLLRREVNDTALQLFVAFATGGNLDHHGALVGEARLTVPAPDGGTQPESDDAFRQRIALAPETFSVAGPELAYVAAALRADGEVAHASVTSPAPGDVVVAVLSAIGDGTASPALLAKVRAVVGARDVRPLTDAVTVQSAQIIPFGITAQVWTDSGPDAALVLATGRTRLDTYIADSRRLGRDITDSGIKAALHVPGVQRVVLPGWADIVVDPTQAAHCTAITVIHAGYDD